MCFLSILWHAAGDMQSMLSNPNSVLPALRYGMNLQLVNGQPQLPMEAPFRILTTCSWEQNAYTVKIYVPLHGVKTDLLRAVFEPHMLDIKAMNLQVKQLVLLHTRLLYACCLSMLLLHITFGLSVFR